MSVWRSFVLRGKALALGGRGSVLREFHSSFFALKSSSKGQGEVAVVKEAAGAVAEAEENPHDKIFMLSGAPEEHVSRHVRIYRPARSAMQQGKKSKNATWHLKFEKTDGDVDRWTNPLMGWTSTGDPLTNLNVSFPTQEAAVEYAVRNGFHYTIEDRLPEKENVRKFQAFGRSMVHQWRHNQIPVYEDDK
uniref:NADH dehydrogenase [ubiquinone] iron-sulfur protein 4, mitochondrial n=1 Tax=Rhodosorus marinus TaxID=101924 RepID=A0A7S3EMI8_9RHOD|mmetsp:Transcript_6286/g.26715  ORF Transcript_6286/g.26715 Transcript_6286/m.26715 type:complete len:191 (+) Transcript_6286:216-788(+)